MKSEPKFYVSESREVCKGRGDTFCEVEIVEMLNTRNEQIARLRAENERLRNELAAIKALDEQKLGWKEADRLGAENKQMQAYLKQQRYSIHLIDRDINDKWMLFDEQRAYHAVRIDTPEGCEFWDSFEAAWCEVERLRGNDE